MRVYLAGPITGGPGYYEQFREAEESLKRLGHEPVNPAQIRLGEGASWAEYMRQALPLMLTCQGVARLPHWTRSDGARLENHVAEALGLHVYNLRDWRQA